MKAFDFLFSWLLWRGATCDPAARHWTQAIAALALYFGTSAFVGTAAAEQNFGSYVEAIANRDLLAIHPAGEYSLLQSSSHDRSPTPLGAPTSFANTDSANFLGATVVDGQTEFIMLEDHGPGVLTRWWMTGNANTNGEIRVYVDGAPTPVLHGQMQPLLSGNGAAFGNSLSFASRPGIEAGHNLYAPIPYSSSVLVTYRGTVNQQPGTNPPVYYNINYRKYEGGADITSYSGADPTTYSQAVADTNRALARPGVQGDVSDTYSVSRRTLAGGQFLEHDLSGGGAIRRLRVKVDGADQAAALRDTYLELQFDGESTARVPVGQFFGNGASSDSQAYNPFFDFYRRVSSDGTQTAYWVMPFQNGAQVKLVNRGGADVTVDLEVDSGAWEWDENSMHFHADYRSEERIRTRNLSGTGTTDWTMLNVRGRGVYVGDTLSIRNRSNAWWGEGDEKIFVDYLDSQGNGSDAQPAHFGTGTEDYYGYAWAHGEQFSRAFVGQSASAGNFNPGVTVNSRVRALDAVPFSESYKFNMEILSWAETELDYGGATFWYGTPGTKSLRLAADLGADYRAAHDPSSGGIPDGAGDGCWFYLSSSAANPSAPGATTDFLTHGAVGNAGHQGYGGGENGHNLGAISDEFLFVDGGINQGIQGGPGYHELALHPAGNATGAFAGEADQPYVVARWIAGSSSAGLANVTGSIRNFINAGDSVDFHIFVDGVERYATSGVGATLPESYFDFDVNLDERSVIDFVLGNGAGNDLFGDESLLRAMIFTEFDPFAAPVPEPTGPGLLGIAIVSLCCSRSRCASFRRASTTSNFV